MEHDLKYIRPGTAIALPGHNRISLLKKLQVFVIAAAFAVPMTALANASAFTKNAVPDMPCRSVEPISNVVIPQLRWVLLPAGTNGTCVSNTDCSGNIFCYGLEYTPAHTGDLTSYTTGFIVECLINDSPVLSNISCVMDDASTQINWCTEYDLIQFKCLGTGMFEVTESVPVIIHQVCFSVPPGTTLNVLEDGVTDLTTAIDLPDGSFVTEYPEYENLSMTGLTPNVVANTEDDGCGSLRQMIDNAVTGSTITFASSLMGQTIAFTSGVIDIDKDLIIQGLGMLDLVLSGNNSSIIFHLLPGNDLIIKDIALKNASAPVNGGALFAEGNLTLENVLLQNNFENGSPKAISVTGTTTVNVIGTVEMKN